LVGVAFEEGDQHFHADAGDSDATVAVAGPVAGNAQPATGLVVRSALTIPMELDLHPSIFIAVDVLAGRAGDDSGLAAEDAWLGILEGWTVRLAPRRGSEVVAIALSETASPLTPMPGAPALFPQGRGSRRRTA